MVPGLSEWWRKKGEEGSHPSVTVTGGSFLFTVSVDIRNFQLCSDTMKINREKNKKMMNLISYIAKEAVHHSYSTRFCIY